jgi:hypothetical protein
VAHATLAEYKTARPGVRDGSTDEAISDALDVASAEVDAWCQRSFAVSGSTSAKVYHQTTTGLLLVDDFSTTTGLVVADNETTLTVGTDFYVDPAGMPGHPFYRLRFYPYRWSMPSWEPLVSVTAAWGWTAVPEQVKRATILLAADLMTAAGNSFGFVGVDVGAPTRVRQNLIVAGLLAPFRRGDRTAL